jgi:hypothetical protein
VPGTSLRCWSRTLLSQFTVLATLRTCFWKSVKLHWLCWCHTHYSVPAHKVRQITLFTLFSSVSRHARTLIAIESVRAPKHDPTFHKFSVLTARRKIVYVLAISKIKTNVDYEDETACSFETLVFIYKTTRCHNLEDHTVLNMLTGDSRNFKFAAILSPKLALSTIEIYT